MNLADKLEELLETSLALADIQSTRAKAKVLSDRSTQLEGFAKAALRLAVLEAGLEHHAPIEGGRTDYAPLKPLVAAYRVAMAEDETGGSSEFNRLVKTMTRLIDASDSNVDKAVAKLISILDVKWKQRAELTGYQALQNRKDDVAVALEELGHLRRKKTWLQSDPSSLQQLLDRRQRVIELVDSILAEGIPASVLRFLKAAAEDGATVEMLQDESVQEYLRDKDLIEQVRVFLR